MAKFILIYTFFLIFIFVFLLSLFLFNDVSVLSCCWLILCCCFFFFKFCMDFVCVLYFCHPFWCSIFFFSSLFYFFISFYINWIRIMHLLWLLDGSILLIGTHHIAYFRVHSRANSLYFSRSVLYILAISGTNGSSGFGSHSREQMDKRTVMVKRKR